MNNDLELGINFVFNTPEAEAEAKRIETSISSIGKSADGAAAKLKSSISKLAAPAKEQIGLIERLNIKLAEYQEKANTATSVKSIELANAQIQEFQEEIARLTNVGEAGFDELGRNITKSFERPTGELNRAKEALMIYQKYAEETFNPELLAKYNAKIEQTTEKIKQLKSLDTSIDASGGSIPETLGSKENVEELPKSYASKANGSNDLSEITSYNKQLEETRAEIEKTANAGNSVFDKFGDLIAKSGGALLTKVFPPLKYIDEILPGIGVAGLLAFAVDPITTYLASLDLFSKKISEAIKLKAMLTEVQLKGAKDAQDEVTNLKLLYQQYQNSNLPLAQRKEAYSELQEMYPGYFENLKFENEATEKTKASFDKLTTSIIATARARAAADKITENAKRQLDNETAINEAAVKQKQVDADIAKNKSKRYNGGGIVLGSSSLTVGTGDTDQVNTIKAVKLEKERADLIKIQNNAKTDSNILAKRNLALERLITEQTLKGGKIVGNVGGTAPAKGKSAETMLNQKRSLQAQVDQIEAEYTRKSKSKDDSEVQAIRDKFKKISDDVKAFNNIPKNKYKVDGSGLDKTRDTAISDLKYKQDTEKANIAFEKQKQLFEDYENYKSNFGKQAADERYGTEVKSSADLLKQKQADYVKLSNKAKTADGLTGGEQSRLDNEEKQIKELQAMEDKRYQDAYNSALTYNQKVERINEEYRSKVAALGKNITDDQKNVLNEERDNAINAAKDVALTKTAIYKKLAQETLELTLSDAKKQSEALKTLLADGSINGEVKSQIEEQLSKLEVTLSIGVNQSNLNDLKAKLALTKDLLNPEKNGGIIVSPDETKRIIKDSTAIQKKINEATNPDGSAKSNFVRGLEENFKYLKGDASTVAAGLSKDLGALSGSFGQLSEAVGGVNTETGYTLDTIAKLAAVGSDAAGSFAAFASGDIIGGVTKAVSAVTGLFSIGKKVKEMNAAARKEVDDFYINAIAGEREYQDLVKERQLQTIRNNKTALQGIRDELALRKSQGAEYAKESEEIMAKLQGKSFIQSESYTHGTWFRKANVEKTYSSLQGMNFEQLSALLSQGKLDGEAKALVERLKELEQKGFDAQQAIADLAKETQVIFTGTTGDSLTDSILDMFKSGKTGAQDLADFFKKTMDGAALSIFKNKVLSDLMNKFYDEFAKKAESNDELTKDETEELQTLFTSLTDEAKTKYEQFKKVAGSDLGSLGEDTGLTGQITKSITEETGSELAGLQRSMYDITKQGVVVAKDSLAAIKQQTLYQYQIEINTRETATQVKNAVSELQTINSNMKGSGSTAYDRGFL